MLTHVELDRHGRRIDSRPVIRGEPLPLPPRSKWTRGGMALDQMPTNFSSTPPMDPAKAQAIGARKQQMDQSPAGAISKEHAAALHDLAHKAGTPESDLDAFARVLATLCGGGEAGGAAQDRNGGKISRARAAKAYDLAAPKLSPADLAQFVEMLKGMVDPNLEDEEEEAQGQPGGGMVGDAAREFGFDRIRPDDHYGEPIPPSRYLRQAKGARLALDAASGTDRDAEFRREWPQVARLLR
jgi:hypothetical protein